MGKSRRNRSKAAFRRDPISKPVKPLTDPELVALRESKVLPIIRDLQSSEPKSRASAAAAVSSIIHDSRCRKLLLREQIVPTVLRQTLTDASLDGRAAGWGILHVLAQEEDPDFCVHLYRLDILTAIEYASKIVSDKLLSKEPEFRKLVKAEQKTLLSIASSLIALITLLAEAQDDVLLALSSNHSISNLLFTVLSSDHGANEQAGPLRSDALACLMILTEDNRNMAESITSSHGDACAQTLMKLRSNVDADGVLACGILHNVFASFATSKHTKTAPPGDDSLLIPTLSKVLTTIPSGPAVTNGNTWSDPFEYQQLALEILASIGTELNSAAAGSTAEGQNREWDGIKDDEDMDQDGADAAPEQHGADAAPKQNGAEEDGVDDDGMDDEEMDDDEMEADMDMVTGADDDDNAGDGIDDMPVLKSLLHTAIPELLRVCRLQPSDENTLALHGHALAALNNIAWSVSLVDFSQGQSQGTRKAWQPVGRSIWETVIGPILSSDTADLALATQVTSLAWAVSRGLCGNAPLRPGQHRKFISLYQATKGADPARDRQDPFQGLGVKCIGVLGQLALHPAPVDLNNEIGTFLVTVLAGLPQTPPADAVEALNQVFDVYANEDLPCEEVFWKNNFLKHLEEILPKMRTMLKGIDKKSQPELKIRADEAVMNLNRFLAYKRKHNPEDSS